jgi:hypothetical protein
LQHSNQCHYQLHATEHSIVTADRRSVLVVLLFGVHVLVELVSLTEDGATEPHGVPLERMCDHVHGYRGLDAAQLKRTLEAGVAALLDVTLCSSGGGGGSAHIGRTRECWVRWVQASARVRAGIRYIAEMSVHPLVSGGR